LTSALTTFQQWLLFSGATLIVGCVAWRIQVLPGALRALGGGDVSTIQRTERRVLSIARTSAGLLIVAWLLRLVVQVMGFRDPFVPLSEDVAFLLFEIFWGTVWMAQGAVILLLVGALWLAGGRRGSTDDDVRAAASAIGVPWGAAALLVAGLALTIALSGHAVGADSAVALVVTADSLHTLAAGAWIGTLAVILLAARGTAGSDPRFFAAQISRFSPMALVSGGGLVGMGVVLGWVHLTAVSDLWTEPYGRILSAKVALVLVVFGLGFLNWKRGLPVADSVEGAAGVRRRAATEVGFAVAVLLLTAVLVHAPKP